MIRLQVKRAYDPPAADDGLRVLVDRVWPRGKKKEQLQLQEWFKEVAPSTELRKWFGHDPEKWADFRKRYEAELRANHTQVESAFTPLMQQHPKAITLVYGARDQEHNQALVLQQHLLSHFKSHFKGKLTT
jgi:uncharacterized protein YeaO (DUF488 family)